MSQVVLQTSLLDGYLIPYTSYGRFKLRFGRYIHVSKYIWGVGFSKQAFSVFAGAIFLSRQFEGKVHFAISRGESRNEPWAAPNRNHSHKSLCSDGKNQCGCVLWLKGLVSNFAVCFSEAQQSVLTRAGQRAGNLNTASTLRPKAPGAGSVKAALYHKVLWAGISICVY